MANESKRGGGFLLHTAVVAIAVWVATEVMTGVRSEGPIALLIMAVVLGLVNAIVRPVLVLVTLPLTVITLGLFYFVINGLAFNLAAALVPGFHVDSLWSGILAGIVVSVVSWLIGLVLGTNS
jgi:putative membrane protein